MFVVYDKDMNKLDFPQGVTPLDIYISSISKKQRTSTIEGRSGYVNYGDEYDKREMSLYIRLEAKDTQDYRLIRDEIYDYFLSHDYFYVSETYQPGKRYKVKVIELFIPDRHNRWISSVQIPLEQVELPFAESIGTTKDIEQNGINYNDELWGYGMGLLYDNESQKYKHNTKNFSIYNAGIKIDPFEQFLNIKISNASKNYELKNLTTGDKFKYTGDTTGTLELNGPNITINNLQALRHTNKQFITLAKGWNEFEQSTTNEVEFDFRYYYL